MKTFLLPLFFITVPAFAGNPEQPPTATPYPMCSGQTDLGDLTGVSRTGDMTMQLAPTFFDHMESCKTADILPPTEQVQDKAGAVNEKGDCDWAETGVSCHYHTGSEFLYSTEAERPKYGELHCVFPVASEPDSPRVYGAHFTCAGPEQQREGGHEVNVGAACGKGLLTELQNALKQNDVRCCDDGTLTGTAESRKTAGTLAVRPDFRMASKPIVLDCTALEALTGHSANAPKFGEPVEGDFKL